MGDPLPSNAWDTIYGIDASRLAKGLASQASAMNSAMSYNQDGYAAQGTFTGWSLAANQPSSGKQLQLVLQFASCTLTRPDGSKLAGFDASLVMQFSLEMVMQSPQAPPPRPAASAVLCASMVAHPGGPYIVPFFTYPDGDPNNPPNSYIPIPPPPPADPNGPRVVCFTARSVGASDSSASPSVVTYQTNGSSLTDSAAGNRDLEFMGTAAANWLTGQAGQLAYVLAVVSSPPGLPPWLAPRQSRFWLQQANGATLFFVLNVVDDRPMSDNDIAIDQALLAGAGTGAWDACFYLAPNLLMDHLIAPLFPSPAYSYSNGQISLASQQTMQTIPSFVSGVDDWQPVLTSVTLDLESDNLHCIASGNCDLNLGSATYLNFTIESRNPLGVDSSGALSIVPQPSPMTSYDVPTSWWQDMWNGLTNWLSSSTGEDVQNYIESSVKSGVMNDIRLTLNFPAPTGVQWFQAGTMRFKSIQLSNGGYFTATLV